MEINTRFATEKTNGRANTQHHSAGPFGVETSCHGGIGHQQAEAQGMKKKNFIILTHNSPDL